MKNYKVINLKETKMEIATIDGINEITELIEFDLKVTVASETVTKHFEIKPSLFSHTVFTTDLNDFIELKAKEIEKELEG